MRVPATGSSPGSRRGGRPWIRKDRLKSPPESGSMFVSAAERTPGIARGAIEKALIELAERRGIAVLPARRRDRRRQDAIAVEAHVDALQRDQRADEQRGADDEDQRDRDLARRRASRGFCRSS